MKGSWVRVPFSAYYVTGPIWSGYLFVLSLVEMFYKLYALIQQHRDNTKDNDTANHHIKLKNLRAIDDEIS